MISEVTEPLTDEQVRKRAIGVEDVDQNGLVKRHRVLSQTIFDMLFLKEFIDQSQHEAAHLFMDSISKSGASIRSANLDAEIFTPHRDVGNVIGERRMAFSSAYRKMVDAVGYDAANNTIMHFANIYEYPSGNEEQAKVAREVGPSLDALARHYGTTVVYDARVLIRRFVAGSILKK